MRALRSPLPRLSLWQRFRVWLNQLEAQYQDGEG